MAGGFSFLDECEREDPGHVHPGGVRLRPGHEQAVELQVREDNCTS